jgi:DNA-binding XRE family transcriptional regulator
VSRSTRQQRILERIELKRLERAVQDAPPIKEHRVRRDNAKDERNKVIIAAIRAGITQAEIARTYGVSRQRIAQIRDEHGLPTTRKARRRETPTA